MYALYSRDKILKQSTRIFSECCGRNFVTSIDRKSNPVILWFHFTYFHTYFRCKLLILSSKKIKSSVTSLELKSNGAEKLNVSNLDNDIEIVIPISNPPKNSSNTTQHYFLKPDRISFRSYYADLADVPVSLRLGLAITGVEIEMRIKFGQRPTMVNFDHKFTFMFKSKCDNQTVVNKNCFTKDGSVKVTPSKPGFLYVGLLIKGSKNESQHSRQRRSCFDHRRERRSCVGVKDPPPKGVLKTMVPQYDPNTDVNYTLTIIQSSCLYWSEETEKWTAEDCRVK